MNSSSPYGDIDFKSEIVEFFVLLLDEILQQEIKDSELWLSRTHEESTYKRDLKKRIELINWVLGNTKNPNVEICGLVESRMNDTIQEIKKILYLNLIY